MSKSGKDGPVGEEPKGAKQPKSGSELKVPTGIPTPKIRKGLKAFVNDVSRELKKVNWPAPKETNRLTGIVLAVCLMIVLVLYGMSIVVDTVIQLLTKGRVG